MEIEKLPKDDRYWRLDWLGEVSYPGTVMLRSQPSVKVYFPPLRVNPENNESLLAPDATELREQLYVWLPIGMLGLLGIGDLWQNEKLISRPPYHRKLFERLNIGPGTCTFINSGLSIDERFLLPLAVHPWHRQATQSYCVMLQIDEVRRIIIPCLELIRFYFGSSSDLLHRLFTRPIQPEDLWQKLDFDAERGHLQ
jgi:hypothetical protein